MLIFVQNLKTQFLFRLIIFRAAKCPHCRSFQGTASRDPTILRSAACLHFSRSFCEHTQNSRRRVALQCDPLRLLVFNKFPKFVRFRGLISAAVRGGCRGPCNCGKGVSTLFLERVVCQRFCEDQCQHPNPFPSQRCCMIFVSILLCLLILTFVILNQFLGVFYELLIHRCK